MTYSVAISGYNGAVTYHGRFDTRAEAVAWGETNALCKDNCARWFVIRIFLG